MAIKPLLTRSPRDWTALVFRPLLISAMAWCIAAGWVMSLEAVFGDWNGEYLVWVVGLVTFETLLVERNLRLRQMAFLEPRLFRIRLAEVGIVVVLVKAGALISNGGWDRLVRDAAGWANAPESFFDPAFLVGIVIVGTMWIMATGLAADLAELEDVHGLAGERDEARSSLKSQFLIGAVILLMAVGAQRLMISPAGLGLRPAQISGLVVLPIVYTSLGILLYAQVQLSSLIYTWAREGVPVAPDMEKRWAEWGVIFVAAVSLLALLLPAGDTSLGLYLFMSFAAIAVFVGQLVSFLVLLLLAILLAPCLLLFRTSSGAPPPPPVLPQFPASPAAPLSGDWLFPVKMIVFWGLVVLVLLFTMRTYWHDRQAAGMWRALWEMLRAWWSALVAWFSGGARVVTRLLTRNKEAHAAKTPAGNASWWKQWQARTARERVRRLYLALVERAEEVGYARGRDQTPYEYSSRLVSHVAGNEEALKELTEAFVAARYSRRDFDHGETSRLYRLWKNLRSALRRPKEIRNK